MGKGLGHRFLRHIERNATLLFLIPCDSERGIRNEYNILLNELGKYNIELLDKPRLLAITKCDILGDEMMGYLKEEVPEGVEYVFISAVTQKGLMELKDVLWRTINEND